MARKHQNVEEALPASVIEHAQAACVANAEEEQTLPRRRRSTAAMPSIYSKFQDAVQDNMNSRQGATL